MKNNAYILSLVLLILSIASCKHEISSPLRQQPPETPVVPTVNIALAGSHLWTGINDVAISGNYAYCAMKYGVMVLDISDPSLLRVVSQLSDLPGGAALSIKISGNYCYVANGKAGLVIIDITDPTHPSIASSFSVTDFITTFEITGKYALLFRSDYSYWRGFLILDISNPKIPFIAGRYGDRTQIYFYSVAGDYVYFADYNKYLRVIDISNPASPDSVGSYYLRDKYGTMVIKNNYAYISLSYDKFVILDISTPSVPTLAKSLQLQSANKMVLSGENIFKTNGNTGFQVVNISNPTEPVIIHTSDPGSKICIRSVNNERAVFTFDNTDLQIFNVTNPSSPMFAGDYNGGIIHGVAIAGNYTYIACGTAGLKIMNITNPAKPTFVICIPTDTDVLDVKVNGDYAYLAVGASGMQIVNISNPYSPTLAGSFATPDVVKSLEVRGNFAYLASGFYGGLQILNITNPSSPAFVSSYDTPGDAIDIAIGGDYAYVTDGTYKGLQIMDIKNPASPTFAGRYDSLGNTNNIAIAGKYAYVSDGALNILDLTTPSRPLFISKRFADITNVLPVGNYIYMTTAPGGIEVADISNPASPQYRGSCGTPGIPSSIALIGNYGYISDYYGLIIVSISTK